MSATLRRVRAICKAALQKELGLPQSPRVPLVGFIGRLTDQKGLDIVAEVISRWVQTNDVQWAILGTGQPKYHRLLETLADRFPQKVAVRLEFSNPLAHRIEAGADLFLMPSRFEPCGLNQLYSLKYGTVPGGARDRRIGRHGGGPLARRLPKSPPANGFSFQEYSAMALSETLQQACNTYQQAEVWKRLITTGNEPGLDLGPQRAAIRRALSDHHGPLRADPRRLTRCTAVNRFSVRQN